MFASSSALKTISKNASKKQLVRSISSRNKQNMTLTHNSGKNNDS